MRLFIFGFNKIFLNNPLIVVNNGKPEIFSNSELMEISLPCHFFFGIF